MLYALKCKNKETCNFWISGFLCIPTSKIKNLKITFSSIGHFTPINLINFQNFGSTN